MVNRKLESHIILIYVSKILYIRPNIDDALFSVNFTPFLSENYGQGFLRRTITVLLFYVQAFNIADVDKDGAISFNDFALTYLKRDTCSLLSPKQIKQQFGKEPGMSTECVFMNKAECVEVINLLGNDIDVLRFDRALKGMMDCKENITLIRLYLFLGMELD